MLRQLCEICNQSPAKVYCENDRLDMCYQCDEEYHPNSNKVASKHVRVELSQKEISSEACRLHPKQKKDIYCFDCRQSLCLSCQAGGFHSEPKYSRHKVSSATDCYQFLQATRKSKSPTLVSIKAKLLQYHSAVLAANTDTCKNSGTAERLRRRGKQVG